METLFTLDFGNYNSEWKHSKRDSARGIIVFSEKSDPPFDENDKIALVYAKNCRYFKFPGGGIHEDEDKKDALIREVLEETGLSVIPESIKEYGVVPRYQKSDIFENTIFDQDSFYYFCQVDSKTHNQNLDAYEAEAGFELQVVTFRQAIDTNLAYKTDSYFDLVMVQRETNVLQKLIGETVEPSVPFAQYILEQGYQHNPGPWREHSIAVAKAAEKIAKAINQNGGAMNPQKAYIYGLLHDIGRKEGMTYMAHVIDGYEYLNAMGFENAAHICITHSFNLQTVDDYIGKRDVTEQQQAKIKALMEAKPYDDYDRLIQLLDSTCSADGTQNLEARMNDVKARYGSYPEPKWNKNFELKDYFEKLMNREFYEVIK